MRKGTIVYWLFVLGFLVYFCPALAQIADYTETQAGAFSYKDRLMTGDRATNFISAAKQDDFSRRPSVLNGTRHLVPQAYATIQAAIEASADGDTVLIADSTYYENISFLGKAIIVASYYLIDGDTSHIEKTIIDGSQPAHADSGSVVYFINGEDTTSVLYGLTIRGGSGTIFYQELQNGETLEIRAGGGIYCDSSAARLIKNIITRNRVISGITSGGGIQATGRENSVPYLILEENRITDNYLQGFDNEFWIQGGGAQFWHVSARMTGNYFVRDTIISASGAASGGVDIVGYSSLPTAHIQNNLFSENIVYAARSGAIGGGMTLAWTAEIMVADNIFENNRATTAGNEGWAQGGGLCITDQDINDYGLKTLSGNRFTGNQVHSENQAYNINGGGIYIYKTTTTLSRNEVSENTASSSSGNSVPTGGGIGVFESGFTMENNILSANIADDYGGGLDVQYKAPALGALVNNTLYANQANASGGGLSIRNGAAVLVMNNIFWANRANTASIFPQIFNSASGYFHYNDIEGGYPGTGIIDSDPLFMGGSFDLSDKSPCLGGGIDTVTIGKSLYHAPKDDFFGAPRPAPAGSNPDLGAVEAAFIIDAIDKEGITLRSYALDQNIPNPFNPLTTIHYQLAENSTVDLSVYNLLGQKVASLVSEKQTAGSYQVSWNASGFASGVYIYKIQTNRNFSLARKLVLLR